MLLGLKIEFLEHKILDYVMRNEFHVSRKLGTYSLFRKIRFGRNYCSVQHVKPLKTISFVFSFYRLLIFK